MPNNAIQLWGPDTCECIIHLAYEDRETPDKRVFTYVTRDEAEAIVQARRDAGERNINPTPQPPSRLCSAHTLQGFTPKHLDTVLGENRRKNMTFGLAKSILPSIEYENYDWSFDENRVLQVRFLNVAATTAQKNQLFNAADIQFGPGLVKVN